EAHGFHVVHDSPLRVALVLAGTAGDVAAALGTSIRFFHERDGRVYHGPDTAPALPAEVADSVHGILGLDDLPHFEPLVPLGTDDVALGARRFPLGDAAAAPPAG